MTSGHRRAGVVFVPSNRLESFGLVRDLNADKRQVRVVASTSQRARDGAIIDQRGWNFSNWDRNSVVLWAHQDSSYPIARALSTDRQVSDTELIETHQFADHPAAQTVFELVRDDFVNSVSIRWLPGETEIRKVDGKSTLVFTRGHEPLEQSYVPIPADTGAVILRSDGKPLDLADFGGDSPEPEVVRCVARDCRNETDGSALCDECSELLDTARVARAVDPRAERLTALAERLRAKAQEGAA